MIAELERRVEMSNSQLRRYASDMKQLVDTERRRSRELAVANERLARLDGLKSGFLSFISHELRTPLHHMAAVDLLDSGSSPEEVSEVVEMVREGYHRLHGLIERGLDYFNWLALEPGSVRRAVDWASAMAGAAQCTDSEIDWTRPVAAVPVQADDEVLTGVFGELLENARVHGPPGGRITIRSVEGAGWTRVEIADGGGFPPEMAEEIFRPFTIVDVRHHGRGSGLGLALSRAMLAVCGGTIQARSEGRGTGAIFIVELKHADGSGTDGA